MFCFQLKRKERVSFNWYFFASTSKTNTRKIRIDLVLDVAMFEWLWGHTHWNQQTNKQKGPVSIFTRHIVVCYEFGSGPGNHNFKWCNTNIGLFIYLSYGFKHSVHVYAKYFIQALLWNLFVRRWILNVTGVKFLS